MILVLFESTSQKEVALHPLFINFVLLGQGSACLFRHSCLSRFHLRHFLLASQHLFCININNFLLFPATHYHAILDTEFGILAALLVEPKVCPRGPLTIRNPVISSYVPIVLHSLLLTDSLSSIVTNLSIFSIQPKIRINFFFEGASTQHPWVIFLHRAPLLTTAKRADSLDPVLFNDIDESYPP